MRNAISLLLVCKLKSIQRERLILVDIYNYIRLALALFEKTLKRKTDLNIKKTRLRNQNYVLIII